MNNNPVNKLDSKRAAELGKLKKGKKHKKTIMVEKLGVINIFDLQEEVFTVWMDTLKNGTKKEKQFAAKELSKYLWPQKRETQSETKLTFEDCLLQWILEDSLKNSLV